MTDHRTPSWISLILWVASTTVGGLIYFFVAFQAIIVLGIPFDGRPSSITWALTVIGAIGGATAGVGIGLAQWLILRKSVAWAGSWARATVLGWVIGGALCGLLVRLLDDKDSGDIWVMERYINIGWLIAGIALGLGIGLGQWLILRRRLAIWWFVLTMLTWAVAWTVVFLWSATRLITTERRILDDSDLLLFWIVVGAVYGIVAKVALDARISKNSKLMSRVA